MKNIGDIIRNIIRHKSVYIISIISFYLVCQGCALNPNTGGSTSGIIEKTGTLTENEVWDGRIYITGTVIVPEGINLTIRAGTIIGFETYDEPSSLIVQGELYAEGGTKQNDSIRIIR